MAHVLNQPGALPLTKTMLRVLSMDVRECRYGDGAGELRIFVDYLAANRDVDYCHRGSTFRMAFVETAWKVDC